MGSRLCGGRPCSALDCETTNGSGSKIFCPGEKVMWAAMQQTTGCSLMRFFTDIERESLGVICPRVLATGTSYTSALTDGRRAAFSIAFSSCWRATPPAVFDLVAWWAAEGRALERAHKALRLQRICPFAGEEPFAAVIRCTVEPAKVDKRTRSKWSRVLRYALRYKSHSEPLDQFIKRKGRINGCAGRFTRCLERAAA